VERPSPPKPRGERSNQRQPDEHEAQGAELEQRTEVGVLDPVADEHVVAVDERTLFHAEAVAEQRPFECLLRRAHPRL
jgi:hypothetical protein